ncbi:MAG TPA: universal stress protein, partial [Nitrososphaerales archaeon]|nr:universal stress protein [Nitrososphaerales archaeon]
LVKKIRDAGVQHEGICGVGDPQDVILKVEKSRDVNYLVMGVHGFHGLSRLRAIGNVTRNVIENSTVPVLAVP